jgi:hypothetical protein
VSAQIGKPNILSWGLTVVVNDSHQVGLVPKEKEGASEPFTISEGSEEKEEDNDPAKLNTLDRELVTLGSRVLD